MEMTFGNAHDIWRRVVSGDNSLTEEEVMIAAKWFEGFIPKLSDKASQSKQELEDAIQAQNAIEKKSKAAEADQRQLDDFIRKYNDLISWLNSNR